MRDEPLIYLGRAVKRTKSEPAGEGGGKKHAVVQPPEVTEQKVNLLIRDLWQQVTDSVHYMQIVNTDAPTHRTKDPVRYLHEEERGGGGCIWRLTSSSTGTTPPLSPCWMY